MTPAKDDQGREPRVKWSRGEDYFAESKCGRYWISPNFNSGVRPQDYDLYYFPPGGGRKTIGRMLMTQRDCKDEAEQHAARTKGSR